jgi:RND family efflux transporter MFP subunit
MNHCQLPVVLLITGILNCGLANGGYAQMQSDEGFSEPLKTVLIAAPESGVIQAIAVREGQTVERGEIICKLDSQVLEASLEVARARFDSQGKIDAAQAMLDDKLHQLKQFDELLSRDHASEQEVRQARLAVDLAKADLRSAYDEKRVSEMEIRQIEAQIERRVIRAPTQGVVLELSRQEGEALTTAEREIATIVCLDQLRVRYFLSTGKAKKMRRGDQIQVYFPTTGQQAPAIVDFVSPVSDSNSGTVRVELLIDNRLGNYRSGLRCLLQEPTASVIPESPPAGQAGDRGENSR